MEDAIEEVKMIDGVKHTRLIKGAEAVNRVIHDALNVVCEMYNKVGFKSEDYAKFEEESPKVMNTIREIEEQVKNETPLPEARKLMERWKKNWEQVFSRRLHFKKSH